MSTMATGSKLTQGLASSARLPTSMARAASSETLHDTFIHFMIIFWCGGTRNVASLRLFIGAGKQSHAFGKVHEKSLRGHEDTILPLGTLLGVSTRIGA